MKRNTILVWTFIIAIIAAVAYAVAYTPAHAAELSAGVVEGWGKPRDGRENGPAVEVRWRTSNAPLSSWVEAFGEPGHIGIVAFGGAYRWSVTPRLYVEPAVGLAAHFGDGSRNFGSIGLFAVQLGAGYQLSDRWSMEIAAEHYSNAFLSHPNDGLNAVALRLVRRF